LIDSFIFRTLLGTTKITQCRTPTQSSKIASHLQLLSTIFEDPPLVNILGYKQTKLLHSTRT